MDQFEETWVEIRHSGLLLFCEDVIELGGGYLRLHKITPKPAMLFGSDIRILKSKDKKTSVPQQMRFL
jgi:hypothetical protein